MNTLKRFLSSPPPIPVSSNRMEGVTVDRSRVAAVVLGKSPLRDRNEEEVRGYRDALKLIHETGGKLEILKKERALGLPKRRFN